MKFIYFILFVVSSILKWILAPIAYIYGTIYSLYLKEWGEYNLNLAIVKDQYGNAVCKYLFNHLLLKKGGYSFGNIDETISSVLGKNKVRGTLSSLGKILDSILNFFDPNHSVKSIDDTENNIDYLKRKK